MDAMGQDLRYGIRQLFRSPGFSALAILCLTLGIGANTAVFSWIEEILFRPYPAVAHQERLVALSGTSLGESGPTAISWPDFLDLQRSCTLCDAFFVSKITSSSIRQLGLRMALGASASNLFRRVVARGLRLTAAGVMCGAAAGLVLTRLFGTLLYNVRPNDPRAFGAAVAVMTITSVAACVVPAWRAMRTDPARVLRD
jgi:hypothetical protein